MTSFQRWAIPAALVLAMLGYLIHHQTMPVGNNDDNDDESSSSIIESTLIFFGLILLGLVVGFNALYAQLGPWDPLGIHQPHAAYPSIHVG